MFTTYKPAASFEEDLEIIEIQLLLEAVYRRHGIDFRGYAFHYLRRRIAAIVKQEELTSVSALQAAVLHDAELFERFLNGLLTSTTTMFRDPEFFLSLRREIICELRTYPRARIWVAGCSSGQEVYSLAIMLTEEGIYDRCTIYATDMNERLIKVGKAGVYLSVRLDEYRSNYYLSGGNADFASYYTIERETFKFNPALRKNVFFAQHNLVSDRSFNEFNLILCRNVLIYFGPSFQERAFNLMHESLMKSGVLAIGLREGFAFNPVRSLYEEIDHDNKLFRRAV